MKHTKKATRTRTFLRCNPDYIPPLSLVAEFITEKLAKEYVQCITKSDVPRDRMYRLLAAVDIVQRVRLTSMHVFDYIRPFITYGKHASAYTPETKRNPNSTDFPRVVSLNTFGSFAEQARISSHLVREARKTISTDSLLESLRAKILDLQQISSVLETIDETISPIEMMQEMRMRVTQFEDSQAALKSLNPFIAAEDVRSFVKKREEAADIVRKLSHSWVSYFEGKGVKVLASSLFSLKLNHRMVKERSAIDAASKQILSIIEEMEKHRDEPHEVIEIDFEEKEKEEKSNGGDGGGSGGSGGILRVPGPPPIPVWNKSIQRSSSSGKRKGTGKKNSLQRKESNGSTKKKRRNSLKSHSSNSENFESPSRKRKGNAPVKQMEKKEKKEKQIPSNIFADLKSSLVEDWSNPLFVSLDGDLSESKVEDLKSFTHRAKHHMKENGREIEGAERKSFGDKVESAFHAILSKLKTEHNALISMKQPSLLLKYFPFEKVLALLGSLLESFYDLSNETERIEALEQERSKVYEWRVDISKKLRESLSLCVKEVREEEYRALKKYKALDDAIRRENDKLDEMKYGGVRSDGSCERNIIDLERDIKAVQRGRHDLIISSRRKELMLLTQVEELAPELLLNTSWTKKDRDDRVLYSLPDLRKLLASDGFDFDSMSLEFLPDRTQLDNHSRHRIFKSTWEGEDVVLKEYVVKDDKEYSRMVRDLYTLGHLSLPYITKVKCVFKDKNFMYVVMPFYGGGPLSNLWKNGDTPPALREIQRYMRQAVLALAQLHERQIAHCDIKPENILLTTTSPPEVVLTGFDVSKSSADRAMATAAVTVAISPGGMTFHYAAPELLCIPPSSATSLSDIYSLGLTFFDLLFPKHPLRPRHDSPFDEKSFISRWDGYKRSEPDTVFGDGDVDLNLVNLLKSMLSTNPKERPSARMILSHPFFSVWESHQMAHIEKKEEKEVERKGEQSTCSICSNEDICKTDGVECPSGNPSHFLCRVCFAQKVSNEIKVGLNNDLVQRGGSVFCRGYNDETSTCHVSHNPSPYSDQAVASCTNDEVFSLYMDCKTNLMEERQSSENDRMVRKRVERELEEMKRLYEREKQIRSHVNHITNNILTLRCPRENCGQVFLDFEGFLTLSCSRCSEYFCGWCLTPADDREDCIKHVNACQESRSSETVYGSSRQFRKNNRRRWRKSLRSYLSSLSDYLSQDVLNSVKPNLKLLKIGMDDLVHSEGEGGSE